jgi:site-specific recombinase
MSVLNLGVSFAVASVVALRAYDVGGQERLPIAETNRAIAVTISLSGQDQTA